ncbi:adenosine deaminase AGSA [Elysia marginata]|uniref:adenosine deaminase n=1 Tax=Elysia marginata TaxID=1093978 RepID=A0AAV4EKB6_9GAST|nr:adenosine deaminase AGSA [Elysia marginata]
MQLVYYLPVFKDFVWHALELIYADNAQYVEYRGQLEGLYDLDVGTHDAEFGTLMLRQIFSDFTRQHPDFIGGKVIMNGYRHTSRDKVFQEVKTAIELHRKYPDFFLGYDLVGDEVWYNSLLYYMDALLYPSTLNPPFKLPYYFHAGETDWQGVEVDYNLIDALLLNTTRIGHGFALSKHPHLAEIARKKQVAVEVCPISNQLLRLVTDLRDHPMTSLMAGDFPVVVSSDDPMIWESLPLSHDFYLALVTMSGEDTGLAFLKQLAINSIRYSGMLEEEKQKAMKLWQHKWDTFIKQQVHQLKAPAYQRPVSHGTGIEIFEIQMTD